MYINLTPAEMTAGLELAAAHLGIGRFQPDKLVTSATHGQRVTGMGAGFESLLQAAYNAKTALYQHLPCRVITVVDTTGGKVFSRPQRQVLERLPPSLRIHAEAGARMTMWAWRVPDTVDEGAAEDAAEALGVAMGGEWRVTRLLPLPGQRTRYGRYDRDGYNQNGYSDLDCRPYEPSRWHAYFDTQLTTGLLWQAELLLEQHSAISVDEDYAAIPYASAAIAQFVGQTQGKHLWRVFAQDLPVSSQMWTAGPHHMTALRGDAERRALREAGSLNDALQYMVERIPRPPRPVVPAPVTDGLNVTGDAATVLEQDRKLSPAQRIVVAVLNDRAEPIQPFLNQDSVPMARLGTGQCVRLADDRIKRRLTLAASGAGVTPGKSTIADAEALLEARAQTAGERRTWLRAARIKDGFALDLGVADGRHRVAYVYPGEWKVGVAGECCFETTPHMRALPDPERGGSLEQLWALANIKTEDRALATAWLLAAMRPGVAAPILEIVGGQGSGKSTTQAMLRDLIDPVVGSLRSPPAKLDDLVAGAGSNWIQSFENVSYLSDEMQDGLCRIVTGGAFAKRQLYSDNTEHVVNVQRPVVLNAIAPVLTRQDAVDRAVRIELPTVSDRCGADEIRQAFEVARPAILGALLDAFAGALERLPDVRIPPERRPRMVEYARLLMAVAGVMGRDPEVELARLLARRDEAASEAIEASPAVGALLEWAAAHRHEGVVEATLGDLLKVLEGYRGGSREGWPRSARGLGDLIRRHGAALEKMGITAEVGTRTKMGIPWTFRFN
ncbi:MAG: hypothetical protein AB1344_03870 [Pseudomonadota bacterium]